jgi:hypothetical protein
MVVVMVDYQAWRSEEKLVELTVLHMAALLAASKEL